MIFFQGVHIKVLWSVISLERTTKFVVLTLFSNIIGCVAC
jgi:hypothetical protein